MRIGLIEKVRLNLEVTPALKAELDELQKRTAASSVSEVLRRAIALYDMLTEHYAKEGSVVLEAKDGTKEKLRIL